MSDSIRAGAFLSDMHQGRALISSVGTNRQYGGELSINTLDNTKIDIEAGGGEVADNYTDPKKPKTTKVTWQKKEAVSLTYLAFAPVTFLGIDSAGDVFQQPTAFTPEQERDYITLGLAYHPTLTFVLSTDDFGPWGRDTLLQFADFISGFGGRLKFSGEITANGNNLQVDRSAISIYGMGIGYSNKKNVNARDREPKIDALAGTITATATDFTISNLIPTDKYDKDGLGALVDIPAGYYTPHRLYYEVSTDQVLLQYGQFIYDSQKKAVTSWEQEAYKTNPILQNLPLFTIIPVIKGCTDLTDTDCAKFIQIGIFGDRIFNKIQNFSLFAEAIEAFDGMSYQRPAITYVNDGGILYADVESEDSGDIIYIFDQKEFILNCTTGLGIGGRARIELTPSAQNFVYVTRGTTQVSLAASTTRPTGKFGWVDIALMPSVAVFSTSTPGGVAPIIGPLSSQRYSDNKSHDGRGALSYEREKIREGGVTYNSGVTPLITITPNPGLDEVDIAVSAGNVKQLHSKTFPALDSTIDGIYVLNDPVEPNKRIDNVSDIDVDANGNSLENTAFNLVVVGIASTADGVEYSKVGILLPNSSYGYTDLQNALQDVSQTAITSVAQEFKQTAFLIARITFKFKQTGANVTWNNVVADETTQTFFNLRGLPLGATSGGAGAPSVTQFLDTLFRINNTTDTTKQIAFDASPITTGNTRTIKAPDRDLDLDTPVFTSVTANTLFLAGGESLIHDGQTFKFSDRISSIAGSANAPAYTLFNNLNTGMWFSAPDHINFSTGGIERFEINNSQATFSVPLVVNGNLYVNGDKVAVDSRVSTSDYILAMNFGEVSGSVTSGRSGIETDRGSGNPYVNMFFEANDDYRVGIYYTTVNYTGKTGSFNLNDEVEGATSGATGYVIRDNGTSLDLKVVKGVFTDTETINNNTVTGSATVNGAPVFTDDTQSVATREDAPIDEGVVFWNNTTNKFETDSDLRWDGTTLNIVGELDVLGKSFLDDLLIIDNEIQTTGLNQDLILSPTGTGKVQIKKVVDITGNDSNLNGPHINAYTSLSATHPIYQQLNWNSDNVNQSYGAYFSSTGWISSDVGSNCLISKVNDEYKIQYDSGISVGNTPTWNDGLRMNLINGHIGLGGAPHATYQLYVQSGFSIGCQTIYGASDLTVQSSGGTAKAFMDNSTGYFTITTSSLYVPDAYSRVSIGRGLNVNSLGLFGTTACTIKSKNKITDIEHWENIYKLKPVNFEYRLQNKKGEWQKKTDGVKRMNFIAEEVHEYFPETTVDYIGENGKIEGLESKYLIAPLVCAIKNHKEKIDELEKEIRGLKKKK